MIDIHCHLLPGIDDGPGGFDESLSLARLFIEAGVHKVVATPHFIPGVYRWTIGKGDALRQTLMDKIREEGLELETYLSAEVGFFPELPEWIGEGKIPLMPDGRHILIETPVFGSENVIRDMVFAILSIGMVPILAHPERNPLFMDLEFVHDLVASECELQLDAGGLIGHWGSGMRRASTALIDNGLVRYIASDSHGPRQRPPSEFLMAAEDVEKTWGTTARQALFHDNPLTLLPPDRAQTQIYQNPPRSDRR